MKKKKNEKILVKPKKSFGQNFLVDNKTIEKILDYIEKSYSNEDIILEIGPGLGAITNGLFKIFGDKLHMVELDNVLCELLKKNYSSISKNIYQEDFLKFDLQKLNAKKIMIVGNLPYNISSPILFKILNQKNLVDTVIFTLQKEVAERLAAKTKTRQYGIPSLFFQTFYNVNLLFTIPPDFFFPIPKVTSALVKLSRNNRQNIDCCEQTFSFIVKKAFSQKRKTLKNSLKENYLEEKFLEKRAYQLSIEDFVEISKAASKS